VILGSLLDDAGGLRIAHCMQASTLFERMRGLLGRAALAEDDALLLMPCASVHTLGMRYPIDVLYLDPDLRIVKRVDNLPPRRVSACWAARATLELCAGAAARHGLELGLRLRWRPV
jgi:uncharacterized protein